MPRLWPCFSVPLDVPFTVHLRPRQKSGVGNTEATAPQKRISAIFYRTEAGGEPVREWLKGLPKQDRKLIGEDIKTVEFGWPLGMPVSRPLGRGLHEVRTALPGNQISRVLFYIDGYRRMVLLHGFIKKTRTAPAQEIDLARKNKARHEKGLKG